MIAFMSTKAKSDWAAEDFVAWRQRLALKQDAAAEALGITARRIRDFEAGRGEIPLSLELACRYLEIERRLKDLAGKARDLAEILDPTD